MERYLREFGFVIPERPVMVDDVRVRGTGRSGLHLEDAPKAQTGPPRVDKMTQCYFEGAIKRPPCTSSESWAMATSPGALPRY